MVRACRLALAGAGAIAQSYIAAARTLPQARLVAIADPRVEAAKAAAESAGCEAYARVEDLLDSAAPDGLIVCTPPSSHVEVAETALRSGVAVLCEKPLCLRAEDARKLRSLAAAREVVFTMASKFRYVDDMVRARAIASSGILGAPIRVENVFTARIDMNGRWNAEPAISGGGVIIDSGTHSADIIRYLIGPVVEVLAIEGWRIQPLEVEDSATLIMRTAAGPEAYVDLSWSHHRPVDAYVTMYGTGGTLCVGWSRSCYRRHEDRDWVEFGSGYDKHKALVAQLRNFCAAVVGGEALLIDIDEAVASVEVIEAAYESLRSGRPVAVAR